MTLLATHAEEQQKPNAYLVFLTNFSTIAMILAWIPAMKTNLPMLMRDFASHAIHLALAAVELLKLNVLIVN